MAPTAVRNQWSADVDRIALKRGADVARFAAAKPGLEH